MVDKTYAPDALQQQMLRTWRHPDVSLREQRLHATLGLTGEAGEVADLIKKWAYKPGRVVTREDVLDELGDVLYYAAVLAHLHEFTFDDMAAHLAGKLADGHGWVNTTEDDMSKGQVMTPVHFRWLEFIGRLDGPEGCDFREDEHGEYSWNCDGDRERPRARAILASMDGIDVEASLAYFDDHGGHCDCEICFNVAGDLVDDKEAA